MKEIGGYLELEKLNNNEYYKNIVTLNTARNALKYLIKYKEIKKVYIPYYLCNVISDTLKACNYKYEYYNIDSNFKPIFDKWLATDEYIYIVNYYGLLKDEDIENLKNKYKNIIVDYTQAFFQNPKDDIDTIYSCRKFFGVPDGAYLSTNLKLNIDLQEDNSKDRMKHLLGRFEDNATKYYKDFIEADKSLDNEEIKYMSKLTHNLLGAIDYEHVKKIREENFKCLSDNLDKYNNISIRMVDIPGPFMYPLLIENADYIRRELIKKKIYIPKLWTNVIDENSPSSIEYKYSFNILPLPCDQRYCIEDMICLINTINQIIQR